LSNNTQVFRAANLIRELEPTDFQVLKGIELGMRRYEAVPIEQISFYARLDKDETQYRLDKLHKAGVLQRYSDLGYVGYVLISESYDMLALHALVTKNLLVAVGDPIARGKESDVFRGKIANGDEVAVKIHRVGQNSFRKVKQLRSYTQNRHHISWLYVDRLSAEKEYEALQKLEPLNLGTPKVFAQNRHIVVMELIRGTRIADHPNLDDPKAVLDEILNRVEQMFCEAEIIHCDLSEFNILMTPDQQITIIDFPQWEPATHPNARSYLSRDLNNVNNFFAKQYGVDFEVEELVEKWIGVVQEKHKKTPKSETH